jgi:hypothetical protein
VTPALFAAYAEEAVRLVLGLVCVYAVYRSIRILFEQID